MSAIEQVRAEANARIASARRRQREATLTGALVRKSAGISTAALYGTLNRLNVPVSIGGFPWKIGVITLATLGEALSSGMMQSACAGVADATQAIYVERSISRNTLVAGNGDSGGDSGGEV
jgi:hypothetical protein